MSLLTGSVDTEEAVKEGKLEANHFADDDGTSATAASSKAYEENEICEVRYVWDLFHNARSHVHESLNSPPILRITENFLSDAASIKFLADQIAEMPETVRPPNITLDIDSEVNAHEIERVMHSTDAAHTIRHWIQLFRLCKVSIKGLALKHAGLSDYRQYLYDSVLRIAPFLENLSFLYLENTTLSPFAIQMIALMFDSKKWQIDSLSIIDCAFQDLDDIAHSLTGYRGLKELAFTAVEYEESGDHSVQAILEALADSPSRLIFLDLKYSRLRERSLAPMISMLETQYQLQTLDLSHNAPFFSKQSIRSIMLETLLQHPSLETLYLNCCFNTSTIPSVFATLAEGSKLEKVELHSVDSVMEFKESYGSYELA